MHYHFTASSHYGDSPIPDEGGGYHYDTTELFDERRSGKSVAPILLTIERLTKIYMGFAREGIEDELTYRAAEMNFKAELLRAVANHIPEIDGEKTLFSESYVSETTNTLDVRVYAESR